MDIASLRILAVEPKEFIKDKEKIFHREVLIAYLNGKAIDPLVESLWYHTWQSHSWTRRVSKATLIAERDTIYAKYRKIFDRETKLNIAGEIRLLQVERDLEQSAIDRDRALLHVTKDKLDQAKIELEDMKKIHKDKWEELQREKKRKKQMKTVGGGVAAIVATYFIMRD